MLRRLGLTIVTTSTLVISGAFAARAHDAHKHHTTMGTEVQSQRLSRVSIPPLGGELVDTAGQPTDLQTLLGERAFILSFSYLDCPEQCPVSDLVMHKLSFDLADTAEAPSLVTLTLDPEHDNHRRLAAHHADFGAPANWHWATGEPTAVHRLLRRLGVETGVPLAEHDVVFFVGSLGSGHMTPVTGLAAPETLIDIAGQYASSSNAHNR